MKKKIAVFTGTRAEYGSLYWLLKDIQNDPDLALQLLVSGTHLSHEFGHTYKVIEEDGFIINEKIEILLSSDSSIGVAKSMGLGVLGFADALGRLKPDFLILLGDRYEALAAAQTAMILRIPVIHLHGGEITEGAYDDAIRHAITKLSYFHFTANDSYSRRVIQLGESPKRVRNVGSIGLDHLSRSSFMSLDELSKSINYKISRSFFLVTYHPVTLENEPPIETFQALLDSLDCFSHYQIIITYPNADDGGRKIIPLLEKYASENTERVFAIPSLGQKRYLSAIKHAAAVIGNSSSGISEVPSFSVPTVNIGTRQKGRLMADSVVNCKTNMASIKEAISIAINIKGLDGDNPYGKGDASSQIIDVLKSLNKKNIKNFYDLERE